MKRISGLGMHCCHDELFSWVYDFDERVDYIENHKPEAERKLRLRLLKLFPKDRIPEELTKAGEAFYKAREAYDKASQAFYKASQAFYKASQAYDKASQACDKAMTKHRPLLEKLHAELCPDCPFDNKTIFTRKDGDGEWY